MQSSPRHLVIAELREAIRRIEHRPARRAGTLSTGLEAVDSVLPGGGFPRGALSEITGGRASGKTAVALAALAALGSEELAAYVDGAGELYPPAAEAAGVDLRRLLVVRPVLTVHEDEERSRRPRRTLAALWAAEALLSSGTFSAVAIDVAVPRVLDGADAIVRRMVSAAERGGAAGLWLVSTAGAMLRLPAAIRIEAVREDGRIAARRLSSRHASNGSPGPGARQRAGNDGRAA